MGVCLNICSNCIESQKPHSGHCYMFREEPDGICKRYFSFESLREDLKQVAVARTLDPKFKKEPVKIIIKKSRRIYKEQI